MFNPISDNASLSEKIIFQITDAIIQGKIIPGDRLPTERDLAISFNVSRTAIRDAIKILSGKGIVDVKHGSGIFVSDQAKISNLMTTISQDSTGLVDLFEVRKILECQAAEWAAIRREQHHIDRITAILHEANMNPEHHDLLNEKDAQFHVAIAEASKNMLLVRIMWTILDVLARARKESLIIKGRAIISLQEHEKILNCIIDKDPILSRESMFSHLDSVESSVLTKGKKIF